MHLIGLVESPSHVCCRYRLAAFRSPLQAAGHELTIESLPRGPLARLQLLHRLRGQTVILQRKLPTFWERTWLRHWAGRLIFDFDDAIFLRDSYSSKRLHHAGRLRRFAALMRACDAVVAGNAFLAEQAMCWGQADRVHVIPTCVEPAKYPAAVHKLAGQGVRLGWIGSSSTLQGLQWQAPLLEEIGCQIPGLHLLMVSDRFLQLRNLAVIARPWSEATETQALAECDIGISWVPNDLWSRGKCGLKLLQYMAAGLPVVANPVGVHADMIRHGENGFLADSPAQWIAAIRRLAADPELRRRMGAIGRQRVEEDYSVRQGGSRWAAMLAGLDRKIARVA